MSTFKESDPKEFTSSLPSCLSTFERGAVSIDICLAHHNIYNYYLVQHTVVFCRSVADALFCPPGSRPSLYTALARSPLERDGAYRASADVLPSRRTSTQTTHETPKRHMCWSCTSTRIPELPDGRFLSYFRSRPLLGRFSLDASVNKKNPWQN